MRELFRTPFRTVLGETRDKRGKVLGKVLRKAKDKYFKDSI
jgi:hypothetical protein